MANAKVLITKKVVKEYLAEYYKEYKIADINFYNEDNHEQGCVIITRNHMFYAIGFFHELGETYFTRHVCLNNKLLDWTTSNCINYKGGQANV
jgi:predicted transcriptional regulator